MIAPLLAWFLAPPRPQPPFARPARVADKLAMPLTIGSATKGVYTIKDANNEVVAQDLSMEHAFIFVSSVMERHEAEQMELRMAEAHQLYGTW